MHGHGYVVREICQTENAFTYIQKVIASTREVIRNHIITFQPPNYQIDTMLHKSSLLIIITRLTLEVHFNVEFV